MEHEIGKIIVTTSQDNEPDDYVDRLAQALAACAIRILEDPGSDLMRIKWAYSVFREFRHRGCQRSPE